MEILGIGPMEIILILIVALMVFGPDKLPQIGAKLGRTMRDMRKATRAISEEINATRDAVTGPAKELSEPFQDVADAAKAVGSIATAAKNPGKALKDSVLKELNAPATPTEPAAGTEPENTIAPPSAVAAAALPDAPAALPEPSEALPGPSEAPLALPEPTETLVPPPAEHAANSLPTQTETAPRADTLPPTEEPPSGEPTVKKRKPRTKKATPPADAEPGAGEQ